jgi:hypothetical protein
MSRLRHEVRGCGNSHTHLQLRGEEIRANDRFGSHYLRNVLALTISLYP